jgi:hypothetical protein
MKKELKHIVNWQKTDEYIVVSAETDDGVQTLKRVYPLRLEGEAKQYADELIKARSLAGFTRMYAGGQKKRAEDEAALDGWFDSIRQVWRKRLYGE